MFNLLTLGITILLSGIILCLIGFVFPEKKKKKSMKSPEQK